MANLTIKLNKTSSDEYDKLPIKRKQDIVKEATIFIEGLLEGVCETIETEKLVEGLVNTEEWRLK